jgi:hypothetical protein
MATSDDTEERFWSKVNFLGPTQAHVPGIGNCWEWSGSRWQSGYGVFWVTARRRQRAHRFAWTLTYGAIQPETPFVLHRCDNPLCVRPSHLFVGTHADNVADKITKNRQNAARGDDHYSRKRPESVARGEQSGRAKLTEDQVRAIRRRVSEGEGQGAVARTFGVCLATVNDIVNRVYWKHVE